jgi:hypothetical protein
VGALFLLFLGEAFASAAVCGEIIGGAVMVGIFATVAMVVLYISNHTENIPRSVGNVFRSKRRRAPDDNDFRL